MQRDVPPFGGLVSTPSEHAAVVSIGERIIDRIIVRENSERHLP